jgi:hypothetical protein
MAQNNNHMRARWGLQHWEVHSIQTSPKVTFDALKHAFKPSIVQEKHFIALAKRTLLNRNEKCTLNNLYTIPT